MFLTGPDTTNIVEIDVAMMSQESDQRIHPSIKYHSSNHTEGAGWG